MRAIDDQAVHHGHQALGQDVGQLTLPPEDKRQVGIEVGKNGVAETPGDGAGEIKSDLLAAHGLLAMGQVAVRGDPCANAGHGLAAIDLHQDGAAGVLAGEIADDGRVLQQRTGLLGIDHQVHERSVGARFVLVPEFAEFAVNFANRHFGAQFRTLGHDAQ